MQWRLLKLFPQCFGVVRSEEALTLTQWRWCEAQLLLDDGALLCPRCATLGAGSFCYACGELLEPDTPERQTCPQCRMPGHGAFCVHCGGVLRHPLEDDIEHGVFDWTQWAQALTPYLGGFTAHEQQLLAQERA
jgi:hypothetical protein